MLKIKDDIDLKELEKFGFKPDARKDVLMSVKDELFGTLVILNAKRYLYFYTFSENIYFAMLQEGLIESVEETK